MTAVSWTGLSWTHVNIYLQCPFTYSHCVIFLIGFHWTSTIICKVVSNLYDFIKFILYIKWIKHDTLIFTHTFLQSSKLTCLLSHNVTFIYFLVIEAKSYSLILLWKMACTHSILAIVFNYLDTFNVCYCLYIYELSMVCFHFHLSHLTHIFTL